ncbi:MAG: hypothetical protein WC942_10835 [Clostridia bacterium]
MADITMCAAKNCKLEKRCYRKTAINNDLYQSISDFSDGREIKKEEDCEYFWNNSEYQKKDKK